MTTGLQNAWSKTAASNGNADTAINFAEGQAPSTLNDAARALMAVVRKFYEDMRGGLVTGGTSTAYTLATNEGWDAYADGMVLKARLSVTNGASATLNVDSLGAKAIQVAVGTAAAAGSLIAGAVYSFTYYAADGVFIVAGAAGRGTKDVGDVFATGRSTAPGGSVLCYGQAISRTTYADLFSAIGTTFGVGNGTTTFNVPDLRGRTIAGKDDMGGSAASRLTGQSGGITGTGLGNTGGAEIHQLTSAQNGSHTHTSSLTVTGTFSGSSDANTVQASGTSGAVAAGGSFTAPYNSPSYITVSGTITGTASGTTGSSGSGAAHNNVQPTMILNYCIYTGV